MSSSNKRLLNQTSPEYITINSAKKGLMAHLPSGNLADSLLDSTQENVHLHQQQQQLHYQVPQGIPQQQQLYQQIPASSSQQMPPFSLQANRQVLQTVNANSETQPNTKGNSDAFSWQVFDAKMSVLLQDVARKSDLNSLQVEIQQLRVENASLKEDLNVMKTRLNYIEKATIRSNIVVSGLACTAVKPAINEFVNLSNSVLKTQINVTEARKLPNNNGFVFTLNTNLEANAVMSAKNKLRGTNVFIQKDSTSVERTAMYHLRQLSKAVRFIEPNLKVRNGNSCVYINDVLYTWSNDVFIAPSENDVTFLRSIAARANFPCNIAAKSKRSQPTQPGMSNNGALSTSHQQGFQNAGNFNQ